MVRIVLTLHTLIIGLIGLSFIFYPTLLLSGDEVFATMTRSFGVSCVAMSVLSALLLTMEGHKHVKQVGMSTLTFFHFGLSAVHVMGWLESVSPFAFPLVHLLFFILSLILTMRYYK